MDSYVMAVEGLESLRDIENLEENSLKAARNAINRTADRTRTAADRQIREKINFPAAYLRERLAVRGRAQGTSLEATIRGRDRPTSRARFVRNRNQKPGKAGVTVQVSTSAAKRMNQAFLMKLRNGNLGLAIRLKPGQSLTGSRGAKRFSVGDANLYLLYDPCVDQAFRTVMPDQEKDAAAFLEREFTRLMEL